MTTATLQARVQSVRYEARGIVSIELCPASEEYFFPQFEAGAHVDLHLNNGLVRSYSLTNPGELPNRYEIAVINDRNSRGGSRFIHEQLRVGDVLPISPPRNLFPLNETTEGSVLIAGGIGITPIFAMLKRLVELGRKVDLIYSARSKSDAAFAEKIFKLQQNCEKENISFSANFHFDDELGGPPNLQALLSSRKKEAHFYCCGPTPMLDAFELACTELGFPNVHLERFAAKKDVTAPAIPGYQVQLKKSGRTLLIPAGVSLLDSLLQAGVSLDYSCKEGICGACETKVLAGTVDHRDQILSLQEKATNRTMMVCVSGCSSGELILDL